MNVGPFAVPLTLLVETQCYILCCVAGRMRRPRPRPGRTCRGWRRWWPSPSTPGTVQYRVQYSTVQPLNSRVSLSCRAEARPPPSVRWTKDGIPIEEEVTRSLANTYRVRQLRGSIHLVPCTHTRKFIHIIISPKIAIVWGNCPQARGSKCQTS